MDPAANLLSNRAAIDILERMSDGFVVVGPQWKVAYANPHAGNVLGARAASMAGRTLWELLPPLVGSELEEHCRRAMADRVVARCESRGVDPAQRLEVEAFPCEIGLSIFLRDVTGRYRAEDALRELNETLERRVAERTALAEERALQLRALASDLTLAEQRERRRLAVALHDELAQALAVCKLKLALVASPPGAADSPARKALDEARDAISVAIQYTRGLMHDLSPPMLYELGLGAALESLAERMGQQHGLAVKVVTSGRERALGEDMLALLYQGVRELFINVIKHARTAEASLDIAFTDREVRVRVEDRGTGFDNAAVRGLPLAGGFGLFQLRERVALLGGHLTLESRPGRGTAITIAVPLPRLQQEPVAPPAGRPDATGAVPVRVLLVDDHKLLREGLANLLHTRPGVQVVGEAADGVSALNMVRELSPDVVIMDAHMPRMSGLDCTRRIVAEFPSVRVIGLCGSEESARELMDAGAVACLSKGGPSDALIAAIHGVASRLARDDSPVRGRPEQA